MSPTDLEQLVEVSAIGLDSVKARHVREVLAHAQVVVQHRIVRYEARQRTRLGGPGGDAVDVDRAVGELEQSGDQAQQRRLPRAVVADKRHSLTGRHGQVERLERGEIAVRLARALHDENRFSHGSPTPFAPSTMRGCGPASAANRTRARTG